nr:hypothetical protein GCM10025732_41660 [Glycomyces mayteni]
MVVEDGAALLVEAQAQARDVALDDGDVDGVPAGAVDPIGSASGAIVATAAAAVKAAALRSPPRRRVTSA